MSNSPHQAQSLRAVASSEIFIKSRRTRKRFMPVLHTNLEQALGDEVGEATVTQRKHNDFVKRMVDKGYTKKQVRLAVEWFLRYRKNN